MSYIRLNYLAALVLGVLSVPAANAQSVVFTNSFNTTTGLPFTTPLAAGQVTVAPNGDVRLTCQLDGITGRCVGFPTGGTGGGGGGNAPTVALSSSAGASVPVNTAFNINASIGNNPESCLRSSSPTVAGWDGAVIPGLATGNIALTQAVPHTLTLKCFNDAGSGSGSVVVTGTGGGGGGGGTPTECTGDTSGYMPPNGYTRDNSVTLLSNLPISSQTQDFKTLASKWLAMSFRGDTDFAGVGSIVLGNGTVGGVTLRYSGYYITISPCQGDFRPGLNAANTPASEPTRSMGCRIYVANPEGNFMQINFNSGAPENYACNVDPSKTYYMNIVLDDPAGGLDPTQPPECISTQCGNGMAFH